MKKFSILITLLVLLLSQPTFAETPNLVGTWTGQAQIASAAGYTDYNFSVEIIDQDGSLCRGNVILPPPLSNGSKSPIYGIICGSGTQDSGTQIYMTGEYVIVFGQLESTTKIAGFWQNTRRSDPYYPHTAKFTVTKTSSTVPLSLLLDK